MRARFDLLQPALSLALAGVGLALAYSVSPAALQRQAAWLGTGAVAYLAAGLVDGRRLRLLAGPACVFALALLVLVHFHGQAALGARRWLVVAGFPLEPSEPAKLVLAAVLAAILSRRGGRASALDCLVAVGLSVPPLALVVLQPDLGTALVLAALLLGMLFVAGAAPWFLGLLLGAATAALPIAVLHLRAYQRSRLEVFLDPARDPLGAGYNLLQARIAVGSGGLFGRGWLAAGQSRLGFVPERATDFAFAAYAEQFGLVGCLLLLLLFGLLIHRLARGAALAPDRLGFLLCAAVAIILLVQVAENIGMNVGLLPVAGIPLPLVSYGGSSLLATMASLGLAQSLGRPPRLVHHSPAWLPAAA